MFKSGFFTSKKKKLANAEAFAQQGNFLIQAKDFEGAVELFTNAIQITTVNATYFANRGEAYRLSGSYQKSIQDCDHSLQISPTAPANCTKARALFSLEKFDEALICTQKAVDLSPTDQEAQSLHFSLQEAKRELQAAVHKKEGDNHLNSTLLQRAIDSYTKAIFLSPAKYSFYNDRAMAYLLYGDSEFAIHDCDKSLALMPNAEAYGRKAAALCNLKRQNEAMGFIKKALAFSPDSQEFLETKRKILLQKVRAHTEGGSKEVGFASMALTTSLVLKFSKRGYFHHNNKALAHLGALELDEALEECHRSIQIANNMKAHRIMALTFCEQGKIEEALSAINTALNMKPNDGQAQDIKRKLEQIQNGLDEDRRVMAVELQIREEQELCEQQVKALVSRHERRRVRLETQESLARKRFSSKFARNVVKKAKHQFIRDYAAFRAMSLEEEGNLLRNQRRSRSCRFITRQESDLLKKQAYARARRLKPPNTIMSDFFSVGLEAEKSPRDVVVLDQRINDGVSTGCEGGTMMSPRLEEITMISELIFKELSRDWKNLKFSITYTDEEELVVAFDAATLRVESGGVVGSLGLNDQGVSRYMTDLAVTGAAAQAKLRPRSDRWRVTESTAVPSQEIRTSPVQAQSSKSNLLGDADADADANADADDIGLLSSSYSDRFGSSLRRESANSLEKSAPVLLPSLKVNGSDTIGTGKTPLTPIKRCVSASTSSGDRGVSITSPHAHAEANRDTKDVLVFSFFVPSYDKYAVSIHGAGSVAEEIKLMQAFDNYTNKRSSAWKQQQLSHKKVVKVQSPQKKKDNCGEVRHRMLPPLDKYGTFDAKAFARDRARARARNKDNNIEKVNGKASTEISTNKLRAHIDLSSPSSLLSSIEIPPLREDNLVERGRGTEFEIYNPATLPRDYDLYKSVRNSTSWNPRR